MYQNDSQIVISSDDKSKAVWSVVKSELGCKMGNISFSNTIVKTKIDQSLGPC